MKLKDNQVKRKGKRRLESPDSLFKQGVMLISLMMAIAGGNTVKKLSRITNFPGQFNYSSSSSSQIFNSTFAKDMILNLDGYY